MTTEVVGIPKPKIGRKAVEEALLKVATGARGDLKVEQSGGKYVSFEIDDQLQTPDRVSRVTIETNAERTEATSREVHFKKTGCLGSFSSHSTSSASRSVQATRTEGAGEDISIKAGSDKNSTHIELPAGETAVFVATDFPMFQIRTSK